MTDSHEGNLCVTHLHAGRVQDVLVLDHAVFFPDLQLIAFVAIERADLEADDRTADQLPVARVGHAEILREKERIAGETGREQLRVAGDAIFEAEHGIIIEQQLFLHVDRIEIGIGIRRDLLDLGRLPQLEERQLRLVAGESRTDDKAGQYEDEDSFQDHNLNKALRSTDCSISERSSTSM